MRTNYSVLILIWYVFHNTLMASNGITIDLSFDASNQELCLQLRNAAATESYYYPEVRSRLGVISGVYLLPINQDNTEGEPTTPMQKISTVTTRPPKMAKIAATNKIEMRCQVQKYLEHARETRTQNWPEGAMFKFVTYYYSNEDLTDRIKTETEVLVLRNGRLTEKVPVKTPIQKAKPKGSHLES